MTKTELIKKAEELLITRRADVLELLAEMIYNNSFDMIASDVHYEVSDEPIQEEITSDTLDEVNSQDLLL